MRILLGGISGLLAVAYVAFSLWADGFRRSWGASPNSAWKLFVPLAVMLLITASTIFPANRLLLHITAFLVAGTAVGCVVIFSKAPILASFGLAYCFAWGWFYWNSR